MENIFLLIQLIDNYLKSSIEILSLTNAAIITLGIVVFSLVLPRFQQDESYQLFYSNPIGKIIKKDFQDCLILSIFSLIFLIISILLGFIIGAKTLFILSSSIMTLSSGFYSLRIILNLEKISILASKLDQSKNTFGEREVDKFKTLSGAILHGEIKLNKYKTN